MPRSQPSRPDAFWRNVQEAHGCWIWMAGRRAGRDGPGYGHFNDNGGWLTHRYAWILANGPIPDGAVVHHLCENILCVRPDHLEAITHAEHNRGHGKGANNREKTHCKKGHEYTPENTRIEDRGTTSARICRACDNARGRAKRVAARGVEPPA